MLEEMYYGKLELQEREWCNKELVEVSRLCDKNSEKLSSMLDDEQKVLLKKLLACNEELISIAERESFIQGFNFGAKLIIESMN